MMVKETRQVLAVGLSLLIAASSYGYQNTDQFRAPTRVAPRMRADERERTGGIGGSDRALP